MPFVIVPAARDCVFVAALEGSGLISYQKASGTFLHALLRALSPSSASIREPGKERRQDRSKVEDRSR